MKKKGKIWISPLIVMGLVLIITNSCKKSDETPTSATDVDGNTYKLITIGTQVWMAENLKTTKYSNGDLIGTTNPSTLDISNESTPKYQWAYGGNENNVASYGRLYTWYAVTDSRNVCPTGWHIPTDTEWVTLTTYLGGENVAGGKLKEAGLTHWQSPNSGATNDSGFTGLPNGYRSSNKGFDYLGSSGSWWSSSESTPAYAWSFNMYYSSSSVSREDWSERVGYSVRCIWGN